jgi:hypothetical protein
MGVINIISQVARKETLTKLLERITAVDNNLMLRILEFKILLQKDLR